MATIYSSFSPNMVPFLSISEKVNEKEEEQDLSEHSNQTQNEKHDIQKPSSHEQ